MVWLKGEFAVDDVPTPDTGPLPADGAAARAASAVADARDDPAKRLRLACSFYDERVGGRSIRAYRRAEVAFMRWQLRRGVLARPDAGSPGSPWWRAVNEVLLLDSTERPWCSMVRPVNRALRERSTG